MFLVFDGYARAFALWLTLTDDGEKGRMAEQSDILFGKTAVALKLARIEQVQECLRIQAQETANGFLIRALPEIMVERGYLASAQVQTVLAEQGRFGGPARFGPYRLVKKLGEGGMGAVYLAQRSDAGYYVALKILTKKNAADATLLRRFQREASVGQKLNHPNLIRTLDFGELQGTYFIAQEYVEGVDLGKILESRKLLPEKDALRIIRDVAAALQHAAAAGLVHRDVKPENIIFDRNGIIKLGDFGLVCFTAPGAAHLTQTDMVVGTAHYISPEQAKGEADLDFRADIYSLGATMYRLVTGRTPFEGSSPAVVMAKHLHEELTPPDDLTPSLSDGCVAIIEKMMAKDREDRYSAIEDLLADLDAVLRGEEPLNVGVDLGKSSVAISAKRRVKLSRRRQAEDEDEDDGDEEDDYPENALGNSGRKSKAARRWGEYAALTGFGLAFLALVGLTFYAIFSSSPEFKPDPDDTSKKTEPTKTAPIKTEPLNSVPIPTKTVFMAKNEPTVPKAADAKAKTEAAKTANVAAATSSPTSVEKKTPARLPALSAFPSKGKASWTPDGRLELLYDFSDPKQSDDWTLLSGGKKIENGALCLDGKILPEKRFAYGFAYFRNDLGFPFLEAELRVRRAPNGIAGCWIVGFDRISTLITEGLHGFTSDQFACLQLGAKKNIAKKTQPYPADLPLVMKMVRDEKHDVSLIVNDHEIGRHNLGSITFGVGLGAYSPQRVFFEEIRLVFAPSSFGLNALRLLEEENAKTESKPGLDFEASVDGKTIKQVEVPSVAAKLDLSSAGKPVRISFQGRLLIPETGSYSFCLHQQNYNSIAFRIGEASCADAIAMTSTDGTTFKLNAGFHPFELVCIAGNPNITVHLHWKPPGSERSMLHPLFFRKK